MIISLKSEFESLGDMLNCIIESSLVQVSPSQTVELIVQSKAILEKLSINSNLANISGLMCGQDQSGPEWLEFITSYAQEKLGQSEFFEIYEL